VTNATSQIEGDRMTTEIASPQTSPVERPAGDDAEPVAIQIGAPTAEGRSASVGALDGATRSSPAAAPASAGGPQREPAVRLRDVAVFYGGFRAVKDISFEVPAQSITALIGPSGSGKSTLLRCVNRMNELIPGARVEGEVLYHGQNLYDEKVDPVEVRRRIGMVFQKPNPFPKSIYDNVAFGPRLNGFKGNMDDLVEQSLTRAALWNDVKDKLKQSGLALSGGQQQRLCIARTIAVEPEIILMDEPASALDPRSTLQIEELMAELKQSYTIIIVTHNMQQAARASDRTVFMNMADDRAGYVVEVGDTVRIFTNPQEQLTEDYISGRFG
jgi:phosphate transport system ATP-binding protein